jgi:hypothetical protein
MVYPLGIGFLHDLPNKPLTGLSILHHPENKGDDLQDLQNAGVMVSLELFGGGTSLRLVDSVSTLHVSIWADVGEGCDLDHTR